MAKRSPSAKKDPREVYAAAKLAAGEHVQVKTTLKSASDVADWNALKRAFPEDATGGLMKRAIREFAKQVRHSARP